MNSMDFLFWALGVGFLILVAFISFTLYNFIQVLKSLTKVIDDASDITQDVAKLKNSLKFGLFNMLSKFIKKRR